MVGTNFNVFFSINLGFFPVSGANQGFLSIILPITVLGISFTVIVLRFVKNLLLQFFFKNLLIKGVVKNIISKTMVVSMFNIIGFQFSMVITCSIITERTFNWPGVGLLFVEGVKSGDIPLVEGVILIISLCFIFIKIIFYLFYRLIFLKY